MATTREIRLANRPVGLPGPESFELVERELPELADGEVLVRNLWMSVDPYMRGRMYDRKSYAPPFAVGEALMGGAIGRVEASKSDLLSEGSLVSSSFGWREAFVAPAKSPQALPELGVPPQAFLGVLGMPGMTAFTGLMKLGECKAADTVFVSAASGAVGSLVAQLAKLEGCRVIGSAGSEEKCEWLRSVGVDVAINYKDHPNAKSLSKAVVEAAPQGVDLYFDNVGGDHLQAALEAMNPMGRVICCGMIAQYNDTELAPGPNNLAYIVSKKLRLQGFIITDHWGGYPAFLQTVAPLVAQAKLQYRETIVDGLERAPEAFIGLFSGANLGKMLVKLAD
jgi:NADPH-dependent curcumin reductase CurA